jgi:hypothetical protein
MSGNVLTPGSMLFIQPTRLITRAEFLNLAWNLATTWEREQGWIV